MELPVLGSVVRRARTQAAVDGREPPVGAGPQEGCASGFPNARFFVNASSYAQCATDSSPHESLSEVFLQNIKTRGIGNTPSRNHGTAHGQRDQRVWPGRVWDHHVPGCKDG